MHLGQKISTVSIIYFLSMIFVLVFGWNTYSESGALIGEERVAIFSIIIGFSLIYLVYVYSYLKKQKLIARCTEEVWGSVEVLGHSNMRVGEEWLINILVSYSGQQQEIKNLEPEFQFRYPQGSRIPLMFNPNKSEEVVVDYDVVLGEKEAFKDASAVVNNSSFDASSIDLQKIIADASTSAIDKAAGGAHLANAQVKSLAELEEKGRYTLTLQVFSDHYDSPYEVIKQMKIPESLLVKLMPGSFVQCRISQDDKNKVSLVFQNISVN